MIELMITITALTVLALALLCEYEPGNRDWRGCPGCNTNPCRCQQPNHEYMGLINGRERRKSCYDRQKSSERGAQTKSEIESITQDASEKEHHSIDHLVDPYSIPEEK